MFQSPRSGKFESNLTGLHIAKLVKYGFNPLDRGNLNQIINFQRDKGVQRTMFQSPRSGKFESNSEEGNSEDEVVFDD